MLNFITSIILASLLIPTGFNFLFEKSVDYSYAGEVSKLNAPQRILNKSFGLKTTAESILIIDNASGAVLYNKNSEAILPIASITKLMTALVVLDNNPDWDKAVTVDKEDYKDGGIIRVLSGEQVTVRDLFYLTLVASANEAAAALARSSGIENFQSAMNKKAAELGMADSYFLDPSGLEVENASTVADLIKLAQAAFSREEIVKAVKAKSYSFEVLNNQRIGWVPNTDQLLDSFLNWGGYKIIGAKTGYLDEAGYCLLFQVKTRDDESLTVALLGMNSQWDRWQEAKGLVDWVFRNYQWVD